LEWRFQISKASKFVIKSFITSLDKKLYYKFGGFLLQIKIACD